MEEKKKSRVMLILIVVLAIIILGLILYICYDKNIFSNKNEPNQLEKTNKKDSIKEDKITKLSEADVSGLIEQLDSYNKVFTGMYPISDTSKMYNQNILNFAVLNSQNTSGDFTLDDIIKKYFGSNFNYTNEDIICPIENAVLYKYNNSTGTYSFNTEHPGHGSGTLYRTKSYFQSGEYDKEKNEYIINAKILYGDTMGDTYGPNINFYSDTKLSNKIYSVSDDYAMSDNYNESEEFDKTYEKYKDQLPISTFTFIKDNNGNYGLVSVKI